MLALCKMVVGLTNFFSKITRFLLVHNCLRITALNSKSCRDSFSTIWIHGFQKEETVLVHLYMKLVAPHIFEAAGQVHRACIAVSSSLKQIEQVLSCITDFLHRFDLEGRIFEHAFHKKCFIYSGILSFYKLFQYRITLLIF